MALKYEFISSYQDAVPSGEVTGNVFFMVKDTTGEGEMKTGINDTAYFTPTFPQTKASWRNNADAAIVLKYPGATPV